MVPGKAVSEGNRTRRSILVVAYHFPPSPAIGGMRPATFVKHFAAFGWDPAVVTIGVKYLEAADAGRLDGLDGIPIVRTVLFPTLRDFYLQLKRAALLVTGRKPVVGPPPALPAKDRESAGQRLKRYLVSLFLTLPDTETGWIIPGTVRVLAEMRKRKSSAFLTSCPPYSVHLIGLLVKRLTGAVWAADFRDPWATAGRKVFPTCRLSAAIEARLEKAVMRNADLVVCTVEQLRGIYRERYHYLEPDKFICIPNAVRRVTAAGPALPKYERFTLSYTGSLYFGRSPEPVFKAVRQLLDEGRIAHDALRIRLVGQCRFLGERPIEDAIAAHGLQSIVDVAATVPQAKAREIIERSHLALLFAPEQPYQVPAKLYEYAALGTPVLAVGSGATGDLVSALGCGRNFSPSDTAGMARFIHEAMHCGGTLPRTDDRLLRQFDAGRLTSILCSHLDRSARRCGDGKEARAV